MRSNIENRYGPSPPDYGRGPAGERDVVAFWKWALFVTVVIMITAALLIVWYYQLGKLAQMVSRT